MPFGAAGGLLAYLVALANSAVLYSVAAGAVALAAMAAGSSMQLEYSGKLFAITYLIGKYTCTSHTLLRTVAIVQPHLFHGSTC
jgi:hypothetical protein